MRRTPWLPSGPLFRDAEGRLDPRFWLLVALIAIFASFIPYAFWFGAVGFLINAALTIVAVVGLTKNVRGERRLAERRTVPSPSAQGASEERTRVEFFFSFPSHELADQAAETLREDAYVVETRMGATEQTWLVRATASLDESDLDDADEHMAGFAESAGGEYDGYRPSRG